MLAREYHGDVSPLRTGFGGRLWSSRATTMDAKVADEVNKHFSTAEGTISFSGGAKKWICIPCKKPITGSATKLRARLLGTCGCGVAACPNVSEDAKNAIREAEQENPSNKRKEPAPSFGLSSSCSCRQPSIAEVFKRHDKTVGDQAGLDGSMSMKSPSTL